MAKNGKYVTLSEETHNRLKEHCDENGLKISFMANFIVSNYLDELEKKKNKENFRKK